MKRFVVDASALPMAFFPDEGGQEASQRLLADWVRGEVEITAPSLPFLETTNAVLVAFQRGRISRDKAHDILRAIDGLSIPTAEPLNTEGTLEIAAEHNLSACDATYASLANDEVTRITGNKRLFEALKEDGLAMLMKEYQQRRSSD